MKQTNRDHEGRTSGPLYKKQDLILLAAVLAVSCLLFFFWRLVLSAPAARADVSVDGQTVLQLDLSEDRVLTVDGWNGGTNTITVKDGAVSVTEASCPDHVCIRTGAISRAGETIVCLPNRLVITVIQDGG